MQKFFNAGFFQLRIFSRAEFLKYQSLQRRIHHVALYQNIQKSLEKNPILAQVLVHSRSFRGHWIKMPLSLKKNNFSMIEM